MRFYNLSFRILNSLVSEKRVKVVNSKQKFKCFKTLNNIEGFALFCSLQTPKISLILLSIRRTN